MELFELEGTFKGHLVQLPCSEWGGAKSPIQPDLECLQGWDIHHLSGQPVPVLHYPYCKTSFPYTQSKAPLFKLKTIFPSPITTDPAKESAPFFLTVPL